MNSRLFAILQRARQAGHRLIRRSAPAPEPGRTPDSLWDQLPSDQFRKFLSDRTWGAVRQVHENQSFRVSGDRKVCWIDHFRERYFKDGFAGDTLSLGCGDGNFDRILKHYKFRFGSLLGVDISETCVAAARQKAAEMNLAPRIEYTAADLNVYRPPENAFDFVFFFHSLHHVRELESLLPACNRALRPGGVFLAVEYVGPSRFQWTDLQVRLADALLKLLPESLRYDPVRRQLRTEIVRVPEADMIRMDPSEAVRSADIDAALKSAFDVVEEKNLGGTLNYLIFDGIGPHFQDQTPLHTALVEFLIHHENLLIDLGILPSDFKYYVGRRRR